MTVYTATVHVQTAAPADVAGVEVALFGSGFLVGSGTTDADGEVDFTSLAAGTYTVVARKRGYSIPNASITVSATATFDVTASSLGLTDPTLPDQCRLYGFVTVPLGERVEVWVQEVPKGSWGKLRTSDGSGVDPERVWLVPAVRILRAEEGRWEFDAYQGSMVRVQIPKIGFSKTVIVPDQTTASITDLRVVLGTESNGLVGDTMITGTINTTPSGN